MRQEQVRQEQVRQEQVRQEQVVASGHLFVLLLESNPEEAHPAVLVPLVLVPLVQVVKTAPKLFDRVALVRVLFVQRQEVLVSLLVVLAVPQERNYAWGVLHQQ